MTVLKKCLPQKHKKPLATRPKKSALQWVPAKARWLSGEPAAQCALEQDLGRTKEKPIDIFLFVSLAKEPSAPLSKLSTLGK